MNTIGSIIIGLITGVVAKLLHPGKDPGGFVISILLGLAGSFLAGWLGKLPGWYSEGEPAGFIFSGRWGHHSAGGLPDAFQKQILMGLEGAAEAPGKRW